MLNEVSWSNDGNAPGETRGHCQSNVELIEGYPVKDAARTTGFDGLAGTNDFTAR